MLAENEVYLARMWAPLFCFPIILISSDYFVRVFSFRVSVVKLDRLEFQECRWEIHNFDLVAIKLHCSENNPKKHTFSVLSFFFFFFNIRQRPRLSVLIRQNVTVCWKLTTHRWICRYAYRIFVSFVLQGDSGRDGAKGERGEKGSVVSDSHPVMQTSASTWVTLSTSCHG